MQRITYAQLDTFCTLQSRSSNDLRAVTKKISQLIAKSWLPDGEDIRKVFLSQDSKEILKMLKKKGIALESIFGPSLEIKIDTNSFEGYIEEVRNIQQPFIFVISYPPKPTEFNVSDQELTQWVENNNSNQFVSDNLYIPVSF
ncbi:MAG: hypothetical protein F6K40_09025 [Okeania sp. SIO3I5]|uniref:hypothetical protein n=1 Tax=Okeania sp. SIO3I5 TaxID=2607805 RepID=UPI0013B6BDD7|nr:hypothetical protein [Okeania sp. SIO3I5]NEQ36406.1 hypothetical protein [Okeania sp. SIO3I5]